MGNFFWGLSLLFLYQNVTASEIFEVNCEDSENLIPNEENETQLIKNMGSLNNAIQQLLQSITVQDTISEIATYSFEKKYPGILK